MLTNFTIQSLSNRYSDKLGLNVRSDLYCPKIDIMIISQKQVNDDWDDFVSPHFEGIVREYLHLKRKNNIFAVLWKSKCVQKCMDAKLNN